MEIDAEDARRYFEGLDYPASKESVAAAAQENDAPDELVERLRTLPTPEFSSPDHVVEELDAAPRGG